MSYHRLPTAPLASRHRGRAAAPWITGNRRASLITAKKLSNQAGPPLSTGSLCLGRLEIDDIITLGSMTAALRCGDAYCFAFLGHKEQQPSNHKLD